MRRVIIAETISHANAEMINPIIPPIIALFPFPVFALPKTHEPSCSFSAPYMITIIEMVPEIPRSQFVILTIMTGISL